VKIAIHQPNFFPFMGFWQKMRAVDVFILLTHCQFARDFYQHRFKHNDKWFTMGVDQPKHFESIAQKRYANPEYDWQRIKNKLPAYSHVFPQFDNYITAGLAQTNVDIIRHVAKHLKIETPILFDYPTKRTGTDRLVDLCKTYHADTYLAGTGGSVAYLEREKFEKAGVKLQFQDPATLDKRSIVEVLA
jgi:hypothetical protein